MSCNVIDYGLVGTEYALVKAILYFKITLIVHWEKDDFGDNVISTRSLPSSAAASKEWLPPNGASGFAMHEMHRCTE